MHVRRLVATDSLLHPLHGCKLACVMPDWRACPAATVPHLASSWYACTSKTRSSSPPSTNTGGGLAGRPSGTCTTTEQQHGVVGRNGGHWQQCSTQPNKAVPSEASLGVRQGVSGLLTKGCFRLDIRNTPVTAGLLTGQVGCCWRAGGQQPTATARCCTGCHTWHCLAPCNTAAPVRFVCCCYTADHNRRPCLSISPPTCFCMSFRSNSLTGLHSASSFWYLQMMAAAALYSSKQHNITGETRNQPPASATWRQQQHATGTHLLPAKLWRLMTNDQLFVSATVCFDTFFYLA